MHPECPLVVAFLILSLIPDATRVAVLPVGAEQLSLEIVPELEALDRDLRAAANSVTNLDLQAANVTKGHVVGARTMGIACGPDDATCLAKLCALADVDRVVQTTARFADDGSVTLKLVLVDANGSATVVEGSAPPTGDTRHDALRALLERAHIAYKPSAPAQMAPPTPPTPPPSAPTPTPAPMQAPPEEPTPSMLLAGVAVAATGGVVALGCGVGALAIEASLDKPEDYDQVAPRLAAGQVLLVVAGAGALVAAAGGVVIGLGVAGE